jgi:molecular chaperone HtpG
MSLNLKDVLKSKNDDLYHDLNSVIEKTEPLLSLIAIDFPQYTLHDINHSELVVIRLNTIIPDSLKEKLNEYEIFFLLCSAYLHDIGMADLEQIKDYCGENAEIIRENHHKRSCIFIRDYFEEVGLKDRFQGINIGKICLGHRKEDLHDISLFPPHKAYKSYDINIALLSSLLRIADELDITFERTPQIIYDNFDISNKKSREEWEKHLSIEGVTSTHNNSFIRCNAMCEDPTIHRNLKKLEDKINSQLEELPDHMHNYSSLIKELPRKFSMEVEPVGYKYYNFKFSLDNKAIFSLLMGEKLYRSKDECIRELLKNSIDACKFRQETTKESYEPKITFELASNNEKLIVTDNGMGMDDFIIEEYFTKIGSSFYSSEDFLNQELDFNPLNELGIGFLSCFMIADEIIIDTKTENSDPLKIEIDNTSDYFLVRKSELKSTGTKITLYLKEDFKENLDLEKIIKNYARHLEFPIFLILYDNNEIEIKEREFIPCPNSIKKERNPHKRAFTFKDKNSIIKIEDDDFEGSICFRYGEDDFDSMRDVIFERSVDNNILSNLGILVSNNIDLLPETIKSLCSSDINLKRNVLDLNVARNDIQLNNKYEQFQNKLELVILNKIRDIFLEIKDSTSINSFFNNSVEKFFNDSWRLITINSFFDNSNLNNHFYDNPFQDNPFHDDKKLPESYLKLFLDFYSFICVSNRGVSFVKTDVLLTKRIIYIDLDLHGFVRRKYLEEYLEYLFNSITLDDDCIYIIEPNYIPKHILESFLDYKPQLLQEVLLKKYENNLRIKEIISPCNDERKDLIIINSDKCLDNRLILINFHDNVFINENNKLIQFIIKNKKYLTKDEKKAIGSLFTNVRNSFSVHEKYNVIKEYFISKEMIKDDPSYLLDKKELDLCRNNYIWKNE